MVKTTNGFGQLNQNDFIETLTNICISMVGNLNFPDQQGIATALTASKDDYIILAQKASGGGRAEILARDAKRAILVTQLQNLGNEVTAVAQGEKMKLDSSGFPSTGVRQSTPPLEKPETLKVFAGVSNGEIACIAKKQPGAHNVTYMITPDAADESSWKAFPRSKSKFVFENLVSGQRYYMKYMLQGVRNQSVESDVETYVAQ